MAHGHLCLNRGKEDFDFQFVFLKGFRRRALSSVDYYLGCIHKTYYIKFLINLVLHLINLVGVAYIKTFWTQGILGIDCGWCQCV